MIFKVNFLLKNTQFNSSESVHAKTSKFAKKKKAKLARVLV